MQFPQLHGVSFSLFNLLRVHRMLGKLGIKNSTEMAIVNANYMKTKLEKNFKILYSGENGRSAHEFIIDCREFKNIILKS